MSLLEACEPIFLEVSKISRLRNCDPNRAGPRLSFVVVRSEIESLLHEAAERVETDRVLAAQLEVMKPALVYFIDDVIKNSNLPIADEWAEKVLEEQMFGTTAGAENFYRLLDADLTKPGREAEDRLAVFYTCLGLGFVGMHLHNPEQVQIRVAQIQNRLRIASDRDPSGKICEKAYVANRQTIYRKPTRWVSIVVAAFGILAIGTLVFFYVIFHYEKVALSDLLEKINKPQAAAVPRP